ncbi:MAG: RecX family transcriptional regulator, partial [Bacteroidetes bacterium]|nr:RecX family transcriptional regulator [Bacteroidota bacterium]
YGLHKAEVEKIIGKLIEEDYLNEERFAVQFAGGRFRMKKWGKVKIRYALRQKNVSEYCIKKGLKAIDEDDYLNTLSQLFAQKLKELKGQKNQFIRKRKIQDYLVQKGYESDLIYALLRKQSNE